MEELYKAINSFKKSKSPGHDGLTIEWYEHFWDLIKHDFNKMVTEVLNNKKMSASHYRGIITGSTYHNLSVLQGPVLLLKIFTYVTEQSQKNSLNKDTGITNFAKPSPNSIIEIFLSSVNTNVI